MRIDIILDKADYIYCEECGQRVKDDENLYAIRFFRRTVVLCKCCLGLLKTECEKIENQ